MGLAFKTLGLNSISLLWLAQRLCEQIEIEKSSTRAHLFGSKKKKRVLTPVLPKNDPNGQSVEPHQPDLEFSKFENIKI